MANLKTFRLPSRMKAIRLSSGALGMSGGQFPWKHSSDSYVGYHLWVTKRMKDHKSKKIVLSQKERSVLPFVKQTILQNSQLHKIEIACEQGISEAKTFEGRQAVRSGCIKMFVATLKCGFSLTKPKSNNYWGYLLRKKISNYHYHESLQGLSNRAQKGTVFDNG